MKFYEEVALKYCERYGIADAKQKDNVLIYYANHKECGKKYTMKATVNLDTGKETRTELKKCLSCGDVNMYL